MNATGPSRAVDPGVAMKSASVGFTVLLLGGVASGLAVRLLPAAGYWWMPLVSVVGYVIAAYRVGVAHRPWLHGVFAAVAAWTLLVPVRLFASDGSWGIARLAADLGVAVAVGGLTGFVAGRIRERAAQERARVAAAEAQRLARERAQRRANQPVRRTQRGKRRPRRRG